MRCSLLRKPFGLLPAGALLATLLVSSGCALIGGERQLDTFDLIAANAETTRATRRQLLIPEPSALKQFDGQNIVVMTSPTMVTYLADAQWSDRLPKLVQSKLLQTFQTAGVAGVGTPGEGLAIDYQLITEVRAFEVDVYNGNRAQVAIAARLLNDRNGQVVRQETFSAEVPLTGVENEDYADALSAAHEAVSGELVRWVLGLI